MINLDAFPEVNDISNLIITEEQYDGSRFKDVWPVFSGDKNPYASNPEMKKYVSWFKDKPEAERLELLTNLMRDKNSSSQRILALLHLGPKNLGINYEPLKTETQDASEIFEHAIKQGSAPLICVEYTMLFLALGNAANLKVGAYTAPTFREIADINQEDAKEATDKRVRREHLVPAAFVKKPNDRFALIHIKIPSGEEEELFTSYPDAQPLNWYRAVLSYINNYARSLEKRLIMLETHKWLLNDFLNRNANNSDILKMNKALELYSRGDYAAAKEEFIVLDKKHRKVHGSSTNSHAEAMFFSAKCQYQLKEYQEAIKTFESFFPPVKLREFWDGKGKYCPYPNLRDEQLNYRGVRSQLSLAEGMMQWADSIQEIGKANSSISAEDQAKIKFLIEKAKEFGYK